MKRFRLSTLLLLAVIVALGVGMVRQNRDAAVREAELRARLNEEAAKAAVRKAGLTARSKAGKAKADFNNQIGRGIY